MYKTKGTLEDFIMTSAPTILAVLRINILDSPIKGVIYVVNHNGQISGLCTCRGHQSPVFQADNDTDAYHQCREWFMANYDGFIQVNKLEGDEEIQEIKKFKNFIECFK
ncbi:MAG: hypothetical protein NE334_17955 [Lentisphaeraceae bacterium]|nr:hypothetical protein [Lentisphaeraceae bacterium]